MYPQSLVFSKSLVTEILGYASSRGPNFSMSFGRDIVARMLVDKPYAQAMAADKAGKLGPVGFDENRIARLCAEFPNCARDINHLAHIVQHSVFWAKDRLTLVSSLTKAVYQGRAPAPPELSLAAVDGFLADHQLTRADVEFVLAGPTMVHRGRHLTFVRHSGELYLKNDFLLEDVSKQLIGRLSVDVEGMMFFEVSNIRDHYALGWVLENGQWSLQWDLHSIADETDLDLTFEQFANGS